MNHKRWGYSIFAAAVAAALFWIGGFDFNERGPNAMLVAVGMLFAAGLTAMWPGFDEEKKR